MSSTAQWTVYFYTVQYCTVSSTLQFTVKYCTVQCTVSSSILARWPFWESNVAKFYHYHYYYFSPFCYSFTPQMGTSGVTLRGISLYVIDIIDIYSFCFKLRNISITDPHPDSFDSSHQQYEFYLQDLFTWLYILMKTLPISGLVLSELNVDQICTLLKTIGTNRLFVFIFFDWVQLLFWVGKVSFDLPKEHVQT